MLLYQLSYAGENSNWLLLTLTREGFAAHILRQVADRGPGSLPIVATRSNPLVTAASCYSLGREGFEPP